MGVLCLGEDLAAFCLGVVQAPWSALAEHYAVGLLVLLVVVAAVLRWQVAQR